MNVTFRWQRSTWLSQLDSANDALWLWRAGPSGGAAERQLLDAASLRLGCPRLRTRRFRGGVGPSLHLHDAARLRLAEGVDGLVVGLRWRLLAQDLHDVAVHQVVGLEARRLAHLLDQVL